MEVQSALFENNVFLMGQHMLQFAMTGRHPQPMPARDNPWAVYDVFTVRDGEQIFLAAVSDAQWQTFCDVLGFADLKADPALATNNERVQARPQLLATLRERLAHAQRRRTGGDLRARRPAVRADPQARGPVRRPAPAGHRRPGRRRAARRRQGRPDGEDHAVPDHDGRRAPAACGCIRRASARTPRIAARPGLRAGTRSTT